ncbi:hypothetical protein [Thalassotalea crassostreae]|uniref:hypothetical protein n=1 Tax=Thalassotalea crassostreae TaxID=1763536 RepID=UPI0008384D17|nr:hypothetical protein [Thalassotalea crassostreae]
MSDNSMNKSALLIATVLTIAISVWAVDVYSDRTKQVITKTSVIFYDDWRCEYSCDSDRAQQFLLTPNQTLDVLRIQYEKDFMVIKVEHEDKTGWIIYDSHQVDLVDKKT